MANAPEYLYDDEITLNQSAETRHGMGLSAREKRKLLNMENELKKRIIGQDTAISAVCRAIRRNMTGFKNPARPVGSFIFVGASGIGKTEPCRALAEVLYGDKKKLLKIDMSEHMLKHEVSKLTGAAPGYIGHENGGLLTNLVKQNPKDIKSKARNLGIKLDFDKTAVAELARLGYDAEYGARPLRTKLDPHLLRTHINSQLHGICLSAYKARIYGPPQTYGSSLALRSVISAKIVDTLSDKILAEELNYGDNVRVMFDENGVVFFNQNQKKRATVAVEKGFQYYEN
ncbi:hypothetical protein FACS1894188_04550 [Clostridia bacterium]|nr:hypothetical protein FACS1894188_04550 [Clostridia bacterium]